ncbi:hypothetical protein GQ600_2575 [Phytophthora cactorum]|nr:hypothetical protein GQ600_2575 [Phytophthora cactorum]
MILPRSSLYSHLEICPADPRPCLTKTRLLSHTGLTATLLRRSLTLLQRDQDISHIGDCVPYHVSLCLVRPHPIQRLNVLMQRRLHAILFQVQGSKILTRIVPHVIAGCRFRLLKHIQGLIFLAFLDSNQPQVIVRITKCRIDLDSPLTFVHGLLHVAVQIQMPPQIRVCVCRLEQFDGLDIVGFGEPRLVLHVNIITRKQLGRALNELQCPLSASASSSDSCRFSHSYFSSNVVGCGTSANLSSCRSSSSRYSRCTRCEAVLWSCSASSSASLSSLLGRDPRNSVRRASTQEELEPKKSHHLAPLRHSTSRGSSALKASWPSSTLALRRSERYSATTSFEEGICLMRCLK